MTCNCGKNKPMEPFGKNAAKAWDNEGRKERAIIIAETIGNLVSENFGGEAMEFGCGTGLISFNLRHHFKNITLIDTSIDMINVLKEKIVDNNAENMQPMVFDLTKDKLAKKFDVIYSSMALHHIHDVEGMIKTFHSMLNENGNLCIVDLDKEDGAFHRPHFDGHNGFTHEYIQDVFSKQAFTDIEIETFYKGERNINNQGVPYSLFYIKGKKGS